MKWRRTQQDPATATNQGAGFKQWSEEGHNKILPLPPIRMLVLNSEVKEGRAVLCWYCRSKNLLCRHPLIVGLQRRRASWARKATVGFVTCFVVGGGARLLSLSLSKTDVGFFFFSAAKIRNVFSLCRVSLSPSVSVCLSFFLSLSSLWIKLQWNNCGTVLCRTGRISSWLIPTDRHTEAKHRNTYFFCAHFEIWGQVNNMLQPQRGRQEVYKS